MSTWEGRGIEQGFVFDKGSEPEDTEMHGLPAGSRSEAETAEGKAERLAGGGAEPRSGAAGTTGRYDENIPVLRCMPKVCEKCQPPSASEEPKYGSRIPPACALELGCVTRVIRWFSLGKPRFTTG